MATYDIDNVDVSALEIDDIINCDYSGVVKTLTLPIGQYKFECWGAQGGYRSSTTYGGKGGYSKGTLTTTEETTFYFYAGGAGNTGGTHGGFNGGGKRYNYAGGGGASDVRIGTNSLYARVIVAGGGGSDGASSRGGGAGGGETAQNTTASNYGSGGYGGGPSASSPNSGGTSYFAGINAEQPTSTYPNTQNETYNGFGWGGGGSYRSSGYGGAGGGGWFGGVGTYPDGSGDDDKGGGGGSGYVYTSSTASNYPTGCLLNSDNYLTDTANTIGTSSFLSPTGSSETGHSGNGYIRITIINIKKGGINGRVNIGGTWNSISNMYVKVNNVWNSVTGAYIKKDGEWLSIGGGSGPSPGPTPTIHTVRIAPTSYTFTGTVPSVTNPNNMYTNTDSDTYADIMINATSTILKLTGFDISIIPSNAIVTNFVVKTKTVTNFPGSFNCYYDLSYIGKSSTSISLSNTVSTYSFDNGNITWEDLKTNFSSSQTALDICFTNKYSFGTYSVYGAEIEVTYLA